jgi:alpha-glucosidase
MYKLLYFSGLNIVLLMFTFNGFAQPKKQHQLTIQVENDWTWWSGVVKHGEMMPLQNGYHLIMDDNYGNQLQPMLLSNQGQVIWSEHVFDVLLEDDVLTVTSPDSSLIYVKVGETLKDGFKYASKNYFPPSGKLPDPLLFSKPQYNTWIELMYDQNQEDILGYAHQVISNGFPPGVLMIDDNWQEDYGKWNFHEGRFSDPKMMIDSLHAMGFKVMLWVCPTVSPDCDVFRKLMDGDMLLEDEAGNPVVVEWWNGYSGLLDLSKKQTEQWFKDQLNHLVENYGVDGFKLDAGDFGFYSKCYSDGIKVIPEEHCQLYGRIGLDFPLNEYRALWKMAGQPIVTRLCDKRHNWEDLQKLVPDIIAQGINGYSFACPDMIGGGEFKSFLRTETIDQELIVRSAQCHALMPMMQFSVAPWRILDNKHLEACKKAVEIREKFVSVIMELARQAANSGEPIVRPMEYVFPQQGYATVKNQFMLGDDILVAPVTTKGAKSREVLLPKGKWMDDLGVIYKGGKSVEVDISLERLPYFTKIK